MSIAPESHDYARFDELAEEFAERYRRGERPSLEEYVGRLPQMADEIREMFRVLVEVEQAERVSAASPLWLPIPRLQASRSWVTTGSCAKSRAAGWGSFTRQSKSRWAGELL